MHFKCMAKGNILNEEGRILQVEYAIKNVSKANFIAGLKCTDGILLAGLKKTGNSEEIEKIEKLSENIFCCFSGIFSDCHQIIAYMREVIQNILMKYNQQIGIEALCDEVSLILQSFTMKGGSRPFAITFLIGGYENNTYKLYSIDPSGNYFNWDFKCFGFNSEKIDAKFKFQDMTLKQGTQKILTYLKEIAEFTEDESEKLEILHLGKNFTGYLTNESIKKLFNEIK